MDVKKRYTEIVGDKIRKCATISFGKIKDENGRRCLEVEATISLDQENNFSAVADVWNCKHSDTIMGGQCFDSINMDELLPDYRSDFQIIKKLWEKYHLNDLNAGTKRQMEYIKNIGGGKK